VAQRRYSVNCCCFLLVLFLFQLLIGGSMVQFVHGLLLQLPATVASTPHHVGVCEPLFSCAPRYTAQPDVTPILGSFFWQELSTRAHHYTPSHIPPPSHTPCPSTPPPPHKHLLYLSFSLVTWKVLTLLWSVFVDRYSTPSFIATLQALLNTTTPICMYVFCMHDISIILTGMAGFEVGMNG
jgi:hypothetical protein